jgi:hypothetical protein
LVPIDQLRAESLLAVRVFEARSPSIQTATDSAAGGSSGSIRVRLVRDLGNQRWSYTAPHTARG